MEALCYVCSDPIDLHAAHDYHAEGCPRRNRSAGDWVCAELPGCDEPVHMECCPVCSPDEDD